MNQEQLIKLMDDAKLYDLTQGCSIFTPPWPGEKALEIHFFKRVTGAYGGGQGAKGFFWEGLHVQVFSQPRLLTEKGATPYQSLCG